MTSRIYFVDLFCSVVFRFIYSLHLHICVSHIRHIWELCRSRKCISLFSAMVKVESKTSKSDTAVWCISLLFIIIIIISFVRVSILHWTGQWDTHSYKKIVVMHAGQRIEYMFRYHFINSRQFTFITRNVQTCRARFRPFKLFFLSHKF